MRFRVATIAFAAAVFIVGLASAASPAPIGSFTLHGYENRPTVLALADGTLVWGVGRPAGELQLRGLAGTVVRTLYRAKLPPVPPDASSPSFRTTVQQSLELLDGTPTRAAFIRRVSLVRTPKCADSTPPCEMPVQMEPLFAEVVAGRVSSGFRVIAVGNRSHHPCASLPVQLDAWGRTAVYAAEPAAVPACRRLHGRVTSIVKVSLVGRPRPQVLARLVDAQVAGLAYAGRYVAWSATRDGRCPCSSVVRLDLRTGKRVRISADNSAHDLALQPDGELVFVGNVVRKLGSTTCGRDEVGYVALGRTKARFLGRPAQQLGGFAGGRIVYVGNPPATCVGVPLVLLAASVPTGTTRTLRALDQGLAGIDFDGRLLATATPVGSDTLVRVERLR
ncbi:MAG TPA: hypothetical protein VF891_06160 [Gaiellaceae bacterium]